ncbi:MAG: DUF2510 domain-containing protein [Nocardioides sp.]|nr:DUF2510 domain-containing protein [Nocardioides sp.]
MSDAPVEETAAPQPASAPPPGWYPDPSDDFEVRWWSGVIWTDHVSTQGWTGVSPLLAEPVPAEEAVVWWGPDPRVRFTTERAYLLHPGPTGWHEVVVPWRAVRGASWQPAGHAASPSPGAPGTPLLHVVLRVDPSAVGAAVHTEAQVPDQLWIPSLVDGARVAAVARMWAARHRRA